MLFCIQTLTASEVNAGIAASLDRQALLGLKDFLLPKLISQINSMPKFEQPIEGGKIYDIEVSLNVDTKDQGVQIAFAPDRNSIIVTIDDFWGSVRGFCHY